MPSWRDTSREALIKSVRVEPVETQPSQTKGFDKLSPNGRYLFSVSLDASQLTEVRIPIDPECRETCGSCAAGDEVAEGALILPLETT